MADQQIDKALAEHLARRKSTDRISSDHIVTAGNIISGLDLSDIGEDGHAVANTLWKIAQYLRTRND